MVYLHIAIWCTVHTTLNYTLTLFNFRNLLCETRSFLPRSWISYGDWAAAANVSVCLRLPAKVLSTSTPWLVSYYNQRWKKSFRYIFYGAPNIFWSFVSCLLSSVYNFDVYIRFLENVCTPGLNCHYLGEGNSTSWERPMFYYFIKIGFRHSSLI